MALVKKRKFVQAVDDVKRHRASGAPMSAIQVRRWVLYVIWLYELMPSSIKNVP